MKEPFQCSDAKTFQKGYLETLNECWLQRSLNPIVLGPKMGLVTPSMLEGLSPHVKSSSVHPVSLNSVV